MVTLEGDREAAQRSFLVAPVSNALNGAVGLGTYRIDSREFVGFYGRVDRSFALITEAPADATFTLQTTDIYQIGASLTLVAVILATVVAYVVSQSIMLPLRTFERDMITVQNGELDEPIRTANRTDEIGSLGRALAALRDQFRSSLEALEDSVRARADYIDATQEVSRFAAAQREIQVLMDRVVALLVERFQNIYHAQIFLVDETGTWAVLRASTGQAGQRLLERGHRLEVGGVSVIGRVTGDGRVVVARDTADSDIHHRNEYLPETRAELAIPLRIGDRVIGALDVQSRQSDSFEESQIRILQTMADQISVAIENARLYQEMVGRLEAVDFSNQQATLNSWREHLRGRRQGMISRQAGVSTQTDTSMLRQSVIATGKPIVGAQSENDTIPFAVPIVLRGQILGAVEWELPVEAFSEHKVQLAQEMVNRLALSLENARLFQESTQAITRERLVNEIAARLTAQTNINDIMRTAVREVGQALRAPQVTIHMTLDEALNDDLPKHENGNEGSAGNSAVSSNRPDQS
jgi:GAF domain-containing protein/HAMP domain-containing protein